MINKTHSKDKFSKKLDIYRRLKQDIITNKLLAGQPLTEEGVVKRYSISRTPVREIFRRLENDGFVKNIPYKGTYVADLKIKDIEEILDMRIALETYAARLAAVKISDEEIKVLNEIEKQFLKAEKSNDSFSSFEADTKLHELIQMTTGNKRLIIIISNLLAQIHRIRFISGHTNGRIHTTVKEHIEIIKALRKKDPNLAEIKMRRHITNTKNLLLQSCKMEEEDNSFLSRNNNNWPLSFKKNNTSF